MTMTGPERNAGPDVDPITVEVIGNALASIVEEMGETLVRAAYSTNVKERRDSSTCLFDARGRTLCQAMHIPMHLGSLMGVVEHVTARHPLAEIRAGDVFIGNDAYTRRRHAPARHRDGRADLPRRRGGRLGDQHRAPRRLRRPRPCPHLPGGPAHPAGAPLPGGGVQQDVLDLILLNCQVPRERLNDLRAQMAANRLGIQRFQSLCGKYGRSLVLAACEALLDYTERMTRAGIATIPPGRLRDSRTASTPTRSPTRRSSR